MIITDKDISNARNMLIRRLLTAKTGSYIKRLTNNTIDEFVVKLWIKSHYDENATFGDFSTSSAEIRFKPLYTLSSTPEASHSNRMPPRLPHT